MVEPGVEGAGGFVEIDDLGAGGKRAGDGHALLLTARQLTGVVVGTVGEADFFQHLHADGISLRFGHLPGDDEALGDVLQGRLVAEEVVVLEDESRLAAQPCDAGAVSVGEVEGLASKVSWPASAVSRKLRQRSRVVLPEPEGPRMATTSPFSTVKSTPRSTSRLLVGLGRGQRCRDGRRACVSMEGFVDAAYL